MQYLEQESLLVGAEHSQKVKAAPTKSDYGSRDCIDLASSTGEFRIIVTVGLRLISAVKQDSLAAVRQCVHSSSALRYIDKQDLSPLHYAVQSSSMRVIHAIITAMERQGISVDIGNRENITPLVSAVLAGREDVVLRLLEARANPNHRDANGFSVLHEAAYRGVEAIFNALRKKGASFTHVTDEGNTALLYARNLGHTTFYKTIKALHSNVTEYSRVLRGRKLLCHMLGISGTTTLAHPSDGFDKKITVDLTGWWHLSVWNLIAKRAPHFFKTSPTIVEACLTATSNEPDTVEALLSRYKEGKPIILNCGFSGHYDAIVLWDFYCIICNRGAHKARTTCEVLRIDPTQVDAKFITQIRALRDKSPGEYLYFLNSNFPRRLTSPLPETIRGLLEKRLSLPEQCVGNCTWANAEAVIFVLLVLEPIIPLEKFPEEGELDRIVKDRMQLFESWRTFMITGQVASYLRRPKILNQATDRYPEDWQLLERIQSKIPTAFQKNEIASLKLLAAARRGELKNTHIALREKATINYIDANGDSALHHAASTNRIEIVKLLVLRGAHVRSINYKGETALYQARKKGHTKLYSYMKSLNRQATFDTKRMAHSRLLKEMATLRQDCDQRELWLMIKKQNNPLIDTSRIIHTGYLGHYVAIVLYDNYLIICNRANQNTPCEVLSVNPDAVDKNELESLQEKTENEFNEFLNKKCPSRLQPAVKGSRKDVLEKLLALKPARTTWANVEHAVFVLFVMQEFKQATNFPTLQELQAVVKRQKEHFERWRETTISAELDRYLKYERDHDLLTLIKPGLPATIANKIDSISFAARDLLTALNEIK
ncbi:MAG: ankyrin repeat domain-containing protein [Verrucomicrobia bacterium]|nr:ankyrin repeat domain-containing protein [Verrucomicrobiota bacterium]MBS0635996.1 ankyrin repeat domain-containing protein [Verrucomicrobiota bacterium]